MNAAAEIRTKRRKARKHLHAYFVVRRMVDPATGVEVGCLVPASKTDRAILRDKGLKIGDRVRCPVRKPRNERFNRLVHGLGTLVTQQVEGFESLDAHSAIKRLQADSGVMCEPVVYQIAGLGSLTRSEPRSLAFDEMDEGEFHTFWKGICAYLIATYWPTLDEHAIESMIDLMPVSET